MEIVNFTPGSALLGGAVIGLAVSVFLLTTGRVAGISGVVGGVVCPAPRDVGWRAAFIAGLLFVGMLAALMTPASVTWDLARSPAVMAVAGLLVGFGTRLGNGCTSGHGVCGLSRMSGRSLAATITFISAGIVTVTAARTLGAAL